MSATLVLSEPKSFSTRRSKLQHLLLNYLFLGVPVVIWAITLLLIAVAVYFDMPVIVFDGQNLVVPF
ncbi:hypothetical protein [Bradyrhizobium sp.]|uniref:hypothetical protein n=1 Tax=Bradyrhizobium sp. TaxID=376 RepID=UPI002D59AA40|nr:hypothetical protein [Bradyrhizobium sp.]HZR72593.1 hypothetical protein [Bradyrhizobium sp.]